MLVHGGRLRIAANEENISLEKWLDLSTGISPFSYPVPPIEQRWWHRLPEDEDDLPRAAEDYFGVDRSNILAVAGSQAAIQTLPRMFSAGAVGVLRPSYNEHEHAWRVAGHRVFEFDSAEELTRAETGLDTVIICNPNNPTGYSWDRQAIELLANKLTDRGGRLIVDEAFIDATPDMSAADLIRTQRIIILRSLGKFFGLAGVRVGFVLAAKEILAQLAEQLGPWTIAGPSRYVAACALSDSAWQSQQRIRLKSLSEQLTKVLESGGLNSGGGTEYFRYVRSSQSKQIFQQLRKRAILTRVFEKHDGLRFGLPASSLDLRRLAEALCDLAPKLVL
jgi:cobalamin biosynthesis protein CobC